MDDSSSLALYGGNKVISTPFQGYNPIGDEEKNAALEVINTGVLSQFIGAHHNDFLGGPKVREFEADCQEYFGARYAITVNSWTSGLIAAVGALDINPGDEIIVPTWTMCATATAIIHWNAIPIFADIENETFNLDLESVRKSVTSRTKAIMSVDIFGHPADMNGLRKIADEFNLKIIADSAQAPGAFFDSLAPNQKADIGGISLNYHKHIHTGEGGVLLTDNPYFAQRMQLIRNHAEAAVSGMEIANLSNMIGYNFRLGEIECAIGIEQLKKLESLVETRQTAAKKLTDGLKELIGLRTPIIKNNCTHVFYVYPMVLDTELIGVSRQKIIDALEAEGVEGLMNGYANIHMLPMFQKKIAYGSKGFPWSANFSRQEINYSEGLCPNAEKLHNETFLGYLMCLHQLEESDLKLLIRAFRKVWANLDHLKKR